MRGFYKNSTVVFGLLSIGLGIALVIETAVHGGSSVGSVGYLLGLLFVGLGIGRLYLLRRR